MLGALARSEGAHVRDAPVVHGAVRTLVELARENAVEGCVRETFGALVAGWQARHAQRLDVRKAMRTIHRDETAHAELAWQVHAWAMARLGHEECLEIEHAMSLAIEELANAARSVPPALMADALGLPAAAQAVALVEALRSELWQTLAA
jgi:hypothetical protein